MSDIPRKAQLELLLSISEGLCRGTDEMLKVSPKGDAIHPPSCGLAIRDAVEEIKWLRAEVERLHRAHQAACEGGDLLRATLRAEVERLRKDLRQGFPIRYATSAGCVCPADASMNCQNSFCPRRNPPGVTCGGGGS